MVTLGRYLIAGGLLIVALLALLPEHHDEEAVGVPASSAPHRLRLAVEATTTEPPRTTVPRASRSAATTAVRPRVAPRARTAPITASGDWRALVASLSWDVRTAFRVIDCESGGNPSARNPRSSARGLFQILHGPLDAIANVRQAFSMWLSRGWQPWNASRRCWA